VNWADRESIRHWRNAQLDVLRQIEPLSALDQDRYFNETVRVQFDQEHPSQFMFAFMYAGELIGYGALVHIHWGDHRAEVSFLTDPKRLDSSTFSADWSAYLTLLKTVAAKLGLHKLTTETYSLRGDLIPILEANGFVHEGVLREHHFVNGHITDSHVHGFLL
jgi:RimJ/RimL family protein N-acetyltransferase